MLLDSGNWNEAIALTEVILIFCSVKIYWKNDYNWVIWDWFVACSCQLDKYFIEHISICFFLTIVEWWFSHILFSSLYFLWLPLIIQDTIFCKSILTEYAVRMNLEKPSYQIIQPDASPRFASSLVFDGNTYTGEFARNKLEAQRLAARAVILPIIGTLWTLTLQAFILSWW